MLLSREPLADNVMSSQAFHQVLLLAKMGAIFFCLAGDEDSTAASMHEKDLFEGDTCTCIIKLRGIAILIISCTGRTRKLSHRRGKKKRAQTQSASVPTPHTEQDSTDTPCNNWISQAD